MNNLLGTMAVVVITLALIAGVAGLYTDVLDWYDTSTALAEIEEIQENLRAVSRPGDYGTLSTGNLVAMGVVPRSMLASLDPSDPASQLVVDPWGGQVELGPYQEDDSLFDMKLLRVPPVACTKLGAIEGLRGIVINGDEVDIPISPDALAAACGQTGGSAGNEVDLLFG